jgi:hypothetical protein
MGRAESVCNINDGIIIDYILHINKTNKKGLNN